MSRLAAMPCTMMTAMRQAEKHGQVPVLKAPAEGMMIKQCSAALARMHAVG